MKLNSNPEGVDGRIKNSAAAGYNTFALTHDC